MQHTILICDDERDIVSALKIYLEADGYATRTAYDGKQALSILADEPIDLVLMDVMMPVMDGITAVSRLRESFNVPVILLTAKSENTDKVLGLNLGADDYVTKPFDPVELLALHCGGLALDDRQKQVTLDGEPVRLTPREYGILRLLMQHPGEVIAPAEIYRRVWQGDPMGAEGTVAVHIRHLREKIEIDPAEPRYLQVVWGQGYRLNGDGR